MSEYTTGEMAKLCGVTVRTVQYYDTRNILVPSRLSEGGRRLYSEEDLKKLKVICFLREIGLPINSIGELLSEDAPENVISILLSQQEQTLQGEISEKQSQLDTVQELMRELKNVDNFSVESITDIANVMKSKNKLTKVRGIVFGVGAIIECIEVATIMLWVTKGIWLPFAIGMTLALGAAIAISAYYFKNVAYICPDCHTVFRPTFIDAFFAPHTPKTRKLECTNCGHKGYCVETYNEEGLVNE